ncbi:ATP-binding protein [Streptomyces sp. NPDC051567]|uniref:ATP-binding protein n=1 Tax=Streptomyces sp. NPDC051567 TaxID=3365660 RepID=UPI00378EFB3A
MPEVEGAVVDAGPPALADCARRFGATPRGARLARRFAVRRLEGWGVAVRSEDSDAVVVIVAELVANAVTHGRVQGRDFELRMVLDEGGVRVEVTDARREAVPRIGVRTLEENGRGLLLVDALSSGWGVSDRVIGKTVWAVRKFE